MLLSLSIRDVVLIERLDLSFAPGLGVLTGETGAGKSILLDALGLALGARAEARLVRPGAAQATVTAAFEVAPGHPARALLSEQGLDGGGDGELVLRRVLSADGRSRAFVNDQPAGVTLLKRLGETLVEVHGQFETQALFDPATHRVLLDAYGGLKDRTAATAAAWRNWRSAAAAAAKAEEELARARHDEEFLRHAVEEMKALAPKAGEEEELAARRAVMMHGEKLIEAMNAAAGELALGTGAEAMLRAAARHLARVVDKAEGRLDEALAALDRAADAAAEAVQSIEKASAAVDLDPRHLEQVEERLFALRACARKHGVTVDDLPRLCADFAAKLAAVEDGGATVAGLKREEAAARTAFAETARALGEARTGAAQHLDAAVTRELGPLKLGKAAFVTRVERLEEKDWGETGCDRVTFLVATNPGMPAGPLDRIASGGELARFMLALKVVVAKADPVPTLVFDEVDAGVGGAVAAAVGERLARLARDVQVLVVTHSPQVAARGGHHWRVAKDEARRGGATVALTSVEALDPAARREEIARMLAGARVTDEARAAADSLLQGCRP